MHLLEQIETDTPAIADILKEMFRFEVRHFNRTNNEAESATETRIELLLFPPKSKRDSGEWTYISIIVESVK